MKLKFVPITLLALLALVSCDPVVDPTDSDDTTPPSTDTSPTDSSDTSTDPPAPETLAEIIARLDEGVASEEDFDLILDTFYESTEGINSVLVDGVYGAIPQTLTATSGLQFVEGAAVLDGDAVEVDISVYELGVDLVGGQYVLWEEEEHAYDERNTIWLDDEEVVHLVNTSDDDPEDAYSFSASADLEDVAFDDVVDFVISGRAMEYVNWAFAAYEAFAGGDDFVKVTLVTEAEKVVDGDEEYLVLSVYTAGSWFGLYSAEAAWGPAYGGVYVDRAEVWGYKALISGEGVLLEAVNYFDNVLEWQYTDNNWEEGDPAPGMDLTPEELAALDLKMIQERTVFYYDSTAFMFSHDPEVEIVLPDLDDYRETEGFDSTFYFDLEDYGFI